MPTIKLYHHGLTAGIAPMRNNHSRAKRGDVNGWSTSAARNNTRFLRSVNPHFLTGRSYAFTLTIRDCPETSADWKKLRRALIKRLERLGMIRLHWVTEWQRRGVPHLHGIAFFPEPPCYGYYQNLIIQHWIAVAYEYGCKHKAQHVCDVSDLKGWFRYLSKHAARGASHYQRSSENIPSGWVKTGRVWGHCGDWPVDEPDEMDVTYDFFARFRRIVRAWRISDARADKTDYRNARISSARRMLRCGKQIPSQVRGVSEWISLEQSHLIMDYLRGMGFE
jgi:hypothetical protein